MLCPKRGKEMTAGYLQSDHKTTIAWVREVLPLGLGYWRKDTELISREQGIGVTAIPAQICKECKLLVGDYSQGE